MSAMLVDVENGPGLQLETTAPAGSLQSTTDAGYSLPL